MIFLPGLLAALVPAFLAAQDVPGSLPSRPESSDRSVRKGPEGAGSPREPERKFPEGRLEYGAIRIRTEGDRTHVILDGWFRLRFADLFLRADRAVLTLDRDEYQNLFLGSAKAGELPRRAWISPLDPKGAWTRSLVAGLMDLGIGLPLAEGKGGKVLRGPGDRLVRLARGLYAEGKVVIEEKGIRKLEAARLAMSFDSRRTTMEDVELRLPFGSGPLTERNALVLECGKAVQQGRRLVAEDASVTTCDAGSPHYRVRSRRVSILRRGEVLEVRGIGNRVEIEGLPSLPLPDYHWYSDQESWLPVQGIRVGRSDSWGEFAFLRFGGRWNDLGGSIVDLAGGNGRNFRGDWSLRTGWARKRGIPLDGELGFRLPGSFEGRVDGFFLEDSGRDRRSITRNLDGSPIDYGQRGFLRLRTRIRLGERTRLDLEAFQAADPATVPEFRPTMLKEDEVPETSVHLVHAAGNLRFGLRGRFNLQDFSYAEDATLSPSFREELPLGRLDVFSQPILELREDWPLVLDLGLAGGRLRNRFDDRAPGARREASWRSDVLLRLHAPVRLGGWMLIPSFTARNTWYSDLPGASSGNRRAFEGEIRAVTRFHRDFATEIRALGIDGLRHEIIPDLRVYHRFLVDREPGDYFSFDEVDTLDEESAIDLGVLQRLRTRDGKGGWRNYLWLDLVQRLHPNAARDNGGNRLGLTYFELIWRPTEILGLLFEGERDFARGDFRTRNLGMSLVPFPGGDLAVEWRSGRDQDGEGALRAGLSFWERWRFGYGLIYDFDRNTVNSASMVVQRRDHDWMFELSVIQDQVVGDTRVQFNFLPAFLGFLQRKEPEWIAGDPAFGIRRGTRF